MPKSVFIGEFEQLVLLSLLHLDDQGYALSFRRNLDEITGRSVSRGALYRTLERLESKRFVAWVVEDGTAIRDGHARRRYSVAAPGVAALKASRATLLELWDGLEDRLR